jgi:hypothetical protein
MWLPWETAFQIAAVLLAVLAAVALATARTPRRWLRMARTTVVELVLMFTLYGVWQYVHERAVTKSAGAMDNARALYRFEQAIHLPSELSVQHLFIDHGRVMQVLNIYYGGAHVTAVGILLVWLFVRHRDRYSRVRNTLAVSIAGCLWVQLIPLAPPRFFPDLGFVDAALLYHQSVYGDGGSGISNQVAAMPSLHVGWAVLVGIAVVAISTSRWRWLALLHPALTVLAVVATANHWWLDGAVAVLILGVAYLVVRAGELGVRRVRTLVSPAGPQEDLLPIADHPAEQEPAGATR